MKIEEFGFDRDAIQANIWQYDGAPEFLSLLRSKDEWYERYVREFFNNWYDQVFRLEIDYDPQSTTHTHTNLFGCTIWALILGFPLEPILTPREGMKQPWAFENIGTVPVAGQSRENFGIVEDPAVSGLGGNFTPAQATAAMTLLEKVQMLKLVYYRNIGNCSVPFLNRMLKDVFRITGMIQKNPDGTPNPTDSLPYVRDGQDMTLTYVFPYHLSDPLKVALTVWDCLPKPSAVKIIIEYPATTP